MRRLALLLLLTATVALAQDARGTILGRVTDSTDALIPDAEVVALNAATGVRVTARTNANGNFTIPYLIPGTYNLSVEMQGFRKFVQEGIQVRVNDQVEVNPRLELGAASETVQVRAETPILATTEASLGQVVDERRVTELPIFSGNALELVQLAPGTTNGTNLRLRKAGFNNAPSQFTTDGSGNYNNEFTIDGITNLYSDGTQPRVAFSPPQTAIAEFKVQTSPFDASIGHTIGSVVNLSTKSGTNEIHGEAHWWVRNRIFDAPTIFQNRSGQELPVYQDNRFGASAGAPVVLPKIYNGKNKTFWFFAYEGNKWTDASLATSTVPTALQRQGNFSELLNLGPAYQLYDPKSTVATGNGQFTRTPFAGNIIPQDRLDPVGQKIINTYPLPNQASSGEQRNNYFNSTKVIEDYWTTFWRVDHTVSEKQRLFLRMHRDFWQEDKNRIFGNDNINGLILNRINRGLAFDDVYVFSPSFLLNFRYGVTQQEFPERRVSQGFDLASLGFGPSVTNYVDPALATFPRVRFGTASNGYTTLSNWESGDGTTSSIIHTFSGNFTWIKGNHNIRFGPEFRVNREFRNRFNLNVSPDLLYNTDYVKASNTAAGQALGGELASMLLGVPAGEMALTASYAEQDLYWGFYIHDDFKVSRKLTLNLGLRYELETPLTERYDRAVRGFLYQQPNPIGAAATANYARNPIAGLPVDQFRVLGGLTFANAGGAPRNYYYGETNNFLPRFGFAYQATAKTVLRGGYGWFFNSIGVLQANTFQTGFSQSTPIQASLNSGLSFVADNANPFPNGLLQPRGAAGGLTTNLGQDIRFFENTRKQPYAQRWSFGLQQELPMGWMLEASYVGNRATRLNGECTSTTNPTCVNINAVPLSALSTSPTRDTETISYLSQTSPNPFLGLDPVYTQNTTRRQLIRPYPHFGNIMVARPIGYSWYHSLQTRLEKRFSAGYTVQASYTWSKNMEATQFLNDADPRPTEVISALDRTHRFIASGIWELPFGRGRKWGNQMNSVANFIAGGWQLNGIVQHQTGEPMAFGNRILTGDIKQIALSDDERSVDRWFRYDSAGRSMDFNNNASQQLGDNVRTLPLRFSGIRGPGQDRWDFSAFKNFTITERWKMQFRAECFNSFNHPNLANPNTDPTSTAWGSITSQDTPRQWQMALKLTF